MAGAFDDLIPGAAKGKGAFDDLVPNKPPEDPIKAEVRKELADLRKAGVPIGDGRSRQFLQGATFGFADEALAGLTTPLEMIKRGTFSPSKGYNYAKAREDVLLEDARKEGGISGMGMEALGGFGTGLGLAAKGMTFVKPGAGAMANIPRAAADGAVFGGLTGFGEGSGVSGRLEGAATGGAVGAGLGAAAGAAAPVISGVGRNALGWLSATRDPQGFANRQVARALSESGMTPQQVAQEVAAGNAAGQPFTVADAMGNAGQRMLSNVTRAPGIGRTMATEFLDNRQTDQGRRLAAVLAEGFDAPQTAAQAQKAMKAARNAEADINYGAAGREAGAVDVTPAIQKANDVLQPGVNSLFKPAADLAPNSIERAVKTARAYLTNDKSQVTDFRQALLAKQEIDAMIENASPTIQRQLIPIKKALDDALAASSQPYAQARDKFSQQSKALEAIDTGSAAAQRGRFEDTMQAFGAMSPESQQGFRVGYADRLIEAMQGPAAGANKARPLSGLATQTELPAFAAPGKAQPMMERIGRENRMFETRAQALGGSKTADNLADQQATGVNPEIIGNVLSGNYLTALKNLTGRSTGALSGYTPKVREALAKALLAGDGATLEPMLQQIAGNQAQRDKLIKALTTGLLGGGTNLSTVAQRRN